MNHELDIFLIEPYSSKEKNYCSKYGIEVNRLTNGITIVSIPRGMDDGVWANIHFKFASGAIAHIPGTVHFAEHFINKNFRDIASINAVDVNAYTSQAYVGEIVKGIFNHDVTNYGVLQILPLVREALEQPITSSTDIDGERLAIQDEVRRDLSSHEYYVDKHLRSVVYSSDNPLSIASITGTVDEVASISKEQLLDAVQNVFIPDGLLISIYTEGDLKSASILHQEIYRFFKDFPREGKKARRIKESELEKINPDFKSGEIYTHNTGLKNSKATVQFVWVLENNLFSVENAALKRSFSLLQDNLHKVSRYYGWAYHTFGQLISPSDNLNILSLNIDLHSLQDIKKFSQDKLLPAIQEEVIQAVTPRVTSAYCELEKKKQQAIPMNAGDRLDWALDGLKDHNAIIDADEMKNLFLDMTSQNMNNWIKILFNTPPAILITGDLK